MTSFASQIRRRTMNTMGLSFTIPGMYRHFDLPDLAAAIAPRAIMVMNGTKDPLFEPEGVKAAFTKIAKCYEKAGAPGSVPSEASRRSAESMRARRSASKPSEPGSWSSVREVMLLSVAAFDVTAR